MLKPQLQIWNAILLFEPLFGQLSALFLQAWIARESVLRALWIQSNLFKTLSTPKSFHRPFDLSNHYKMAHSLQGRFGMWFAMWGQFAKRGSSFTATLSKAMLTKQFTKSHVLLDKDTHWTMSLLKWHQSVDTTNNTVCWQIISCTSFCLWLSFIMQIGNQVLLLP